MCSNQKKINPLGKPFPKRVSPLAALRGTKGESSDDLRGRLTGVLDTLARSLFMQGKKERAIELENQALKLAETDQQEMLQKTLDSYKKGVLPKAQ